MTELNRKEAIETINRLSQQKEPFIFVVDYARQHAYVSRLSEVDPAEMLYDFCGTTNADTDGATGTSKVEIQAYPSDYQSYKMGFDTVMQALEEGRASLINFTCSTPVTLNIDLKELFYRTKAMYRLWIRDRFTVFSPEIFVRINGDQISSYPMKGTIDATLANAEEQLINNPKELAEHKSVTKLLCDDLATVANNVTVRRFRYIDRIDTNKGPILQTSSEITGTLPHDHHTNLGGIIFDMLPGGSISGSPKESAINIIEEAENYNRGYYTGIAGIFDGKNLDSTVLIRYIEHTPEGTVFKSGGGITVDSNPKTEYEEMVKKIYIPVNE